MDSESWINLAIAAFIVLSVACSFLFTSVEIALAVLGRLYARQMVENGTTETTAKIEDPARFLTGILVGTALVDFAAILALAVLLMRLWPQVGLTFPFVTAWLAGSLVILLLGEMVPRALAAWRAQWVPGWAIQLVLFIERFILGPLIALLMSLTSAILVITTGRGVKEIPFPQIVGLSLLTEVGEKEHELEEGEREMIQSIFEFGDTEASEIMVPRISVKALDLSASLQDVLEIVVSAGHSRIPVYEGTIDNIVGILYAKDLLHYWKGRIEMNGSAKPDLDSPDYRLQEYLRKPNFVPENKPIAELLQEFRRTTSHMAIVVDEYGGTAGIITIEDILEEIVGEIQDEYDQEPSLILENPDGSFIVDARTEIEDLETLIGVEFPEEDYETIGGYIFLQLGDVPDQGYTLYHEDVKMTVLEVDDRRIHKIRVERIPEEQMKAAMESDEDVEKVDKDGEDGLHSAA